VSAVPAPRRVHVLYEHGHDQLPYGTAYLRLLRPLGHPSLAGQVALSWGRSYHGEPADVVVVDRLWRPDATEAMARALIGHVRAAGARLVHALDDDLLGLPVRPGGPTTGQQAALEALLPAADGLLVTTAPLAERLRPINPRIAVVPNALDERLIPGWPDVTAGSPFDPRPVVGYMGTFTHDEDLRLVAEALKAAHRRLPHGLVLEVVSALRDRATLAAFGEVPVRLVRLPAADVAYLPFNLWFSHRRTWQLAIAPLVDTPFNRCKSDLKYLDYAAGGLCGVYSDVGPYRPTIRHLDNGWRAANTVEAWTEAVTTLLGDAQLRARLAATAARELRTTRLLAQRAVDWAAALDQLAQ
jgi:glycosyltransferase involved in cell wall biosynthesis